eukprot:220514-Amphidinium_carterae.2
MGACMIVEALHSDLCSLDAHSSMWPCCGTEVNTWFLITRRSFNKNGDKMCALHSARSFLLGAPSKTPLALVSFGGRALATAVGVQVDWTIGPMFNSC